MYRPWLNIFKLDGAVEARRDPLGILGATRRPTGGSETKLTVPAAARARIDDLGVVLVTRRNDGVGDAVYR